MRETWLVTVDNPVVRDHRVLGQHLLPGLAYIDLLYQAYRKNGHDHRELELRNLTIFQPLVLSKDGNVLLDIQCQEQGPDRWNIEITGQLRHGRQNVGAPKRYA